MEAKVQVILPEDYAKSLRMDAAIFLTEKYDELLQKEIPKREDYASAEEWQEAKKRFMLESVDFVETNKKAAFVLTLDQYNEFLRFLNQYNEDKNKNNQRHTEEIEKCYKRNRRTLFATIAATLIYPAGFPAYLIIGATQNGWNSLEAERHRRAIIAEEGIYTVVKDFQNRMFDLTDIMRTDYHQSKKEIEDLKERAKKGENVMPILLQMISPEKLSLPRVEQQEIEKKKELFQEVKRLQKAIYE